MTHITPGELALAAVSMLTCGWVLGILSADAVDRLEQRLRGPGRRAQR